MFEKVPTYDKRRTLSLKSPMMKGEDVYALQNALNALGFFIGAADGILGPQTERGIREAQRNFFLKGDGLAGEKTNTALATAILDHAGDLEHIPDIVLRGQIEWESGFWLGIYSDPRPEGDFDAGVAQRNTKYTPAQEGFNPSLSILALAEDVRKHYDLFAGVTPVVRRWRLAQGAWNAPAYACYIAREEGATKVTARMTEQPSATSRKTLEEYMTKVSKYL
jgi:hypothetical protein